MLRVGGQAHLLLVVLVRESGVVGVNLVPKVKCILPLWTVRIHVQAEKERH